MTGHFHWLFDGGTVGYLRNTRFAAMITFWFLLTVAALLGYSVINAWVAVQGARDIRGMLTRLARRRPDAAHDDA
jgi:hypothetical protein